MKKLKVFALLLSLSLISSFVIVTVSAAKSDTIDLDFYAANGVNVTTTANGVIVTAADGVDSNSSKSSFPLVDVEELDFYAADGVIVTATDATEPVDIFNCVVSDSQQIDRPVTD